MHLTTLWAMDAIPQECIIPWALFNWSVLTYEGSHAQKGLTGNGHAYKLWWYLVGPPSWAHGVPLRCLFLLVQSKFELWPWMPPIQTIRYVPTGLWVPSCGCQLGSISSKMGVFHQDIEVESLPPGESVFDNQLHGHNGSFIKEVGLKRIRQRNKTHK